MINFEIFSQAVHDKLVTFTHRKLFKSAITHPAQRYLAAFPDSTDPIYITNTEHDCTCCKHFVNNLGPILVINDDLTLDSIWNVPNLPYPYDVVAAAMHEHHQGRSIAARHCPDIQPLQRILAIGDGPGGGFAMRSVGA